MTRKIKYIIGMIWCQFKKKKVKRRLFGRKLGLQKHTIKCEVMPLSQKGLLKRYLNFLFLELIIFISEKDINIPSRNF